MIAPLILGADFWARLPPVTLDFTEGTLQIKGVREPVRLHKSQSPDIVRTDREPLSATVLHNVTVPGSHERMIKCYCPGICKGDQYLVEPMPGADEAELVSAAYAMVQSNEDNEVVIRVANMGKGSCQLKEGQKIALLRSDAWATVGNAGRAFERYDSKFSNKCDDMCCKKLDGHKRRQLKDLLQKYQGVFYRVVSFPE